MLPYLFSVELKKLEFFPAGATVTLIPTCAFPVGASERHHPGDPRVSDGEHAAKSRRSSKHEPSFLSLVPLPSLQQYIT